MSANATTAAPTGRKKLAQGKERSAAALGNPPPITSSPEGEKELPVGWKRSQLGEIGRWFGGGTPSKANPNFWTGGKIPWVSPKDMKTERIADAQDHITADAVANSATSLVEKGSVLVVVRSGILKHTLPVAITEREVALNQDLKAVTPGEGVRSDYLALALKAFERDILHTCCKSGTTVQNLEMPVFLRFPIPVAPEKEQRRIVAEIEKQFTRLEAGVAALRRVQANLKRYRAAVLKAACEGRLVPTEAELAKRERRKYEPASELIARTPTPPRPNRWNSRSKDVIPGHPALAVGNPQTKLPEGWAWSALVEIAKMESGHTPSRNHPEWWDGDVAWIGIADARERDGRTIHETFQHTNLEGIANSASRLLPAGTVCISRTASVGYVVVMGREMATSQDFVNWIPTHAVTSYWLRIIFSADREALRRFGKGSVHKTIYFPEWLSMHIAVPPLVEQRRIVAEVERRLSVVEELESVVSANLQRATRLRQSILQKAFTGKLL
jgi:type I restriction enzyme S subunit